MNERKTEDLIEAKLRKMGYFSRPVTVEKQKSDSARVQKLLKSASKKGAGVGKPEFIIQSADFPNLIIVIECKADIKNHQSVSLDKFADYAVDGALLYASYLSKEFDVIAIGASGQTVAELRLGLFLHLRGEKKAIPFKEVFEILRFQDFYDAFINSEAKFRQDYESLLDFSRELNNTLQAKKMPEAERGFLISGVLIALKNVAFRASYKSHKNGKTLAQLLLKTIGDEFESAKLPIARRENLNHAFSFIADSPVLTEDRDFSVRLIEEIDTIVNAFMRTHRYYDTIGQFYVEFLRYANNDKGLGIVLTPSHVAELFAHLADVNKNSVVYDNCCGTAGLLIAAMKAMILDAGGDKKVQAQVKKKQLVGVEFQPKIYALAVSNMILHDDGKTNIYRGDCFIDGAKIAKKHKPTVGILNPPYKNKTVATDKEELEYVYNNLQSLQSGGKCVAIVPITCATAPSGVIAAWKTKLLERHTLEAVMSMPIELFHNSKTTVVTCAMVFTAHRKHPKGKKTWFGYWRDDGFVKTKHRGRVDSEARWEKIKETWVSAYRNREIVPGLSVAREVGAQDEWCAEAYLPADYSSIDEKNVIESVKRFALNNAMLMHDQRAEK